MSLRVVGDVSPELIARLNLVVAGHHILEQVVRWGLRADPVRDVTDVIQQDEYTLDVVVPAGENAALHGCFLVYDTT